MDEIRLGGLRLLGTHGVLAEEQTRAQPFEVDVTLAVDLSRPAVSDELDDTIDYGEVVALVAGVVEAEHFALLERLAGRAAEVVLAHDDRIAAVTVSVRKLRPPVPHDLASAGVCLTRARLVTQVFLGLGSNVGDRWKHLREAVASLSDVVAVSPVYETDPVGGPGGQDAYLNCVVELATGLTPRQILGVCHRLESAAGRVRTERWGPRSLDVDILLVTGVEVDDEDLQIPHPRIRERRFVLEPLRDLAPDLVTEDLERLGRGVRPVGSI